MTSLTPFARVVDVRRDQKRGVNAGGHALLILCPQVHIRPRSVPCSSVRFDRSLRSFTGEPCPAPRCQSRVRLQAIPLLVIEESLPAVHLSLPISRFVNLDIQRNILA